MSTKLKVFISVGELSADEYAAEVVKAIRRYHPQAEFKGMGGGNLRAAGVDTTIDSEAAAGVMGFSEVFKNIVNVLRSFRALKSLLFTWQPDILIIIDYPDFNLRLARAAKALGIPVFYFIPPQIWAWRKGRTKLINKVVDQAAVIFPFEEKFYADHGCHNVTFIGHPFMDRWKTSQLTENQKEMFIKSAGLDPKRPILALFPGSRNAEIQKHLDLVQETFRILHLKHSKLQGILAVAPSLDSTVIQQLLDPTLPIKVIKGKATEIMQSATAGLLKSGTSNLQAAVCGLPFAMFYVTSYMTELAVKSLVKLQQFSIVNVIRPQTVDELVQKSATPIIIADKLEPLLFNQQNRCDLNRGLHDVADSLDYHGKDPLFADCTTVSERAAKLVLKTINKNRGSHHSS
jgi:lipid-A-disaccharide synthase